MSIVTVTFNSAATIGQTLDSVATQSHPDIEHIVVDGASQDDTLNVVRARGSRLAQLVSEPDRGIYDAMNKGLHLATGDMLGFLNADDWLAGPDVIARIAERSADRSVDGVYGDLVYVNQDDSSRVVRKWSSGAYSRSRLRRGWMPPHPTLYVRRAQMQALGGFDHDMRIAADYDFILRFLARDAVRMEYIPEVLVHMRAGGASNRSLRAMLKKSREDLMALRRSGVGGLGTLICKNLRKLPQFAAWQFRGAEKSAT